MTTRTWYFEEPHPTGGVSTVTITEEQIVRHMRARSEHYMKCRTMTPQEMIEDFAVLHWATRCE